MRLLMIGDIVGQPGRSILKQKLPALIQDQHIDFVIANGENAASGSGIMPSHVKELTDCGIHAITTGDHIWKRAQIVDYLNGNVPVLRPGNYPPTAAGRGHAVFTANNHTVGVINLIGRVYLGPADCPFRAAEAAIRELSSRTRLIVIDIHAEATSEKIALARYLDGRVTAVIGTHTHVQTADEQILPGGTAFLTDVGMTGPYDSVIGRDTQKVLHKFVTGMYAPFDVATGDPRIGAVIIDADPATGKATAIQRLMIPA